jgi:hypothetical protein
LGTNDYLTYNGNRTVTDVDTADTFEDGDVTTGTDRITVTAHPFIDGAKVQLTTTGTLPAGLALATDYYVEVVDANTIEFYSDVARTSIVDITAAAGGGTHTITETTRWLEFQYTEPPLFEFESMVDADYGLGYITVATTTVITRPDGKALTAGPSACTFHDGRLFMAGVNDSIWSDYIFFSQVPEKPENFAKCYQEADPTDPVFNKLVDTDGGWFTLQGAQGVKRMLSVRSSLLIFADNGVWEVNGGRRGFFTPSGYGVRKITEEGCSSPLSPIAIGNSAFYTGPGGIFQIAPNQYTGILESSKLSSAQDENGTQYGIQSKWSAIPAAEQQRCMTVYDDDKEQLFLLYGKSVTEGVTEGSYYDEALIMNLKLAAWSYYSWNGNTGADYGITSVAAITSSDTSGQPNKLKFAVGDTAATQVKICDHNQTDYVDFDGTESPLPYVVSGWDNFAALSSGRSGLTQRRKQAPVITVFAKRTETAYASAGNGWDGTNTSSNLLTPYWDWTDDSVSGKIGSQKETYRHLRAFVPSDASDVDGYPVVITRNKLRGRGRVLQLRFDGAATKDSHIMGYSTNYKIGNSI